LAGGGANGIGGGEPGGKADWRPLPSGEIDESLSRVYGIDLCARGKSGGLRVVAEALNRGELARAQIAALPPRLPDPELAKADPPNRAGLVSQLRESGLLAKDWNADEHPRTGTPPNSGWFAPTGSGEADAHLEGGAPARSSAVAAEEVAVLTRNFRYACRVLDLDPREARDAVHAAKDKLLGGADNCLFDTETGDIIFNGDVIGNLRNRP